MGHCFAYISSNSTTIVSVQGFGSGYDMKKLFSLIAALLLLVSAAPVMANTFWNWSYSATSGGSVYGSGTFETASGSGGDILSITGTANGATITGLSTVFGADNILYTAGAPASPGGISFTTASGAFWNLYSAAGEMIANGWVPAGPGGGTQQVTMSVTAVPEPETYAMLLLGLGVIGAISRRRSRAAADLAV